VEEFVVIPGKPLDSLFFLVGASPQRLEADREYKANAIRIDVPNVEWQLTVQEIIDK
jgi:hypothetical protein